LRGAEDVDGVDGCGESVDLMGKLEKVVVGRFGGFGTRGS
jgi:hypothetical protein